MKLRLANSKLVMAAAASLLMMSFTAKAEMKVQNAQYKAQKEVLYIKGKVTDASARKVYVVASRSRLIGSIDLKGKQFRGDIAISEANVPCRVRIQTNRPSTRTSGRTSRRIEPGEFTVVDVRHAPDHCSD